MKKNQLVVLTSVAFVSTFGALLMPLTAHAENATPVAPPAITAPPSTLTATPAGASAVPTPTQKSFAEMATPVAVAAQVDTEYKKLAVLTDVVDNLSLSDGLLLPPEPNGNVLLGPITAPVAPVNDNVLVVDGNYSLDTGPSARLGYQVNWHGQPTGFWVDANFTVDSGSLSSTCEVFQGKPPAGGGTGADPSPLNCNIVTYRDFPNAGAQIHVSLNKSAEAQAVIQTQGTISLQGGHFDFNLIPNHLEGSASVGTNSSTRSDVVLNEGDQPIEPNLARTRFVYQIVEAGTARKSWVMGYSQNYDGTTKYTGESNCAVYDTDPLTAAGDPDNLKPVVVSAYTCTQTSWQFVNGDRGNYEATFMVAKRDMSEVTDPLEQKHLIALYCGDGDVTTCGLSLATVEDTYGAGRPVSGVVNNPAGTDDTLSLLTSNTQSISNSGGFEIDVEGGVDQLGVIFKTTLKVNYQRNVTNTTSTTQKITIVIPPHSRGWIEATPPMVHTVGEIIVLAGDRYFNLTNVVADFPSATDGHSDWEYTTPSEKLPPGQETDAEEGGNGTAGPPVAAVPSTPSDVTRDESLRTGSGATSDLAETGSATDGAPFMAGLFAILVGAGLIFTRRFHHVSRRPRRS